MFSKMWKKSPVSTEDLVSQFRDLQQRRLSLEAEIQDAAREADVSNLDSSSGKIQTLQLEIDIITGKSTQIRERLEEIIFQARMKAYSEAAGRRQELFEEMVQEAAEAGALIGQAVVKLRQCTGFGQMASNWFAETVQALGGKFGNHTESGRSANAFNQAFLEALASSGRDFASEVRECKIPSNVDPRNPASIQAGAKVRAAQMLGISKPLNERRYMQL